jgi:putative restriction endonuclease
MQKYWWVNHKQTAKQEVGDDYLWSPKVETGGNRSQFYNNMTRAQPGDLVLSYATQIASVGRVKDFAFTSPSPISGKRDRIGIMKDGYFLSSGNQSHAL